MLAAALARGTPAALEGAEVDVSLARRLLRFVERGLAVAGLLLLMWHGGFDAAEVVSGSMAPTLQGDGAGNAENDWIVYETVSTRLAAPARHALVVFRSEDGVMIVKRVTGLEGERLRLVDGRLQVDGVVPPGAPDLRYLRAGNLRASPEDPAGGRDYVVPEDAVFLLGDDSKDSWDSRYFGGVPVQRLQGRALAVVWPPARWRWVW
jgi:signal peptidase I